MSDKDIIIYQRGKELEKKPPLELLQLVLLDDMRIALTEMEKSHKKEEFRGKVDSRELVATDELKVIDLVREWPYCPWINAFVVNDGPDTIKIGVNHAYDWLEINANETRNIDHAHADERIERIYYKCDPGETASARVEAHY